ncbi:MAG: DUF3971 domain-containing protein [Deltaproteobacteria bacterium]|nr:DUF3971 domain-containing protein [Deltaproteobacteria bacterium]
MVSRKIKAIGFPLLLLFLLLVACLVLANELIQRPGVQQFLLKELSKTVGYDLQAREIELSLRQGIGISARDLEIRSPEGEPVLSASRIRIELKGRALLKGHILPTRLVLVEPAFELAVGKDGDKDPVSGDLDRKLMGALAAFTSLGVERARVKLIGLPFDLKGVDINLSRTGRDPLEITIFSKGAVDYNDRQIPFTISGTVSRRTGQSLSGDMIVKSEAIPLTALPWPRDLPFHKGVAEIQFKVQGTRDGPIWIKGVADVKDLDFSILDEGDKKRFTFDSLSIPFQARYAAQTLKVPWFKVQGADFSLDGTSRLDFKTPSNPSLTLKVTGPTMPLDRFKRLFPSSLLPSWLETRLFPCFSGGTVRLDDFSLKGTLHQLEDLDRYENAHTLSLDLKCEGLTAFEKGGGIPIKDVSGHVAVKNGVLGVKGAQAVFGSSEIKTGSLTIDTLYADPPVYHASLSGSFDIEDLLRQRHLDLIGPAVNRAFRKHDMAWLLKPGAVNGRLGARVKVAYQDRWDDPKVTGDFQVTSCRLNTEKLVFPAMVKTGMLKLEEKGEGTFTAEGRWGDSDIQLSGSIGKTWKTGRADIAAKADLEGLVNRFYPSLSKTIHAQSRVPAQLTLSKAPGHWSFQGRLHPNGVSMDNEAISISPFKEMATLSFDGRFVPEKEVVFKEIKWLSGSDLPNKEALPVLTLRGSYGLAGTTGIEVDIKAQKLRLQELGVTFKKEKVSAKGFVSCDVRLKIPGSFPKDGTGAPLPTVSGRIEGDQISIQTDLTPLPITDVGFKVRCEKETCAVDFLNLKMGQNACRVEGELRGWRGLKGKLSVTSNYVDLSQLYDAGLFAGHETNATETKPLSHTRPAHSQFVGQTDVGVNLYVKEGVWGISDLDPSRRLVHFGPVTCM